jgi:adenylate cyclase
MPAEAVERRLAAILAADVAGYSRLVGLDEEGTLARLKILRREVIDPEIAAHRGRIVKTTDGLLVEFVSVVDAVRCAVAVQRACVESETALPHDRRIEFRIGVNLGDIVVDGEDILGDGVNVAARLEGIAEPGGICISEDAFRQVQGRVEVEFHDLGHQQLKNITRPIRAYSLVVQKPGSITSPADKPSIAVLPFANMSSDPEQEFLADGIAEDVITALSRYPSLFVIARNSTFTYKGRAVAVRQVGHELGVRYVLEGSLRKSGGRIRVTAQLIEVEKGNHVWAERYDRDLIDFFTVQDEISEAVTTGIAPAIAEAEQQRAMRKPPDSLDAWSACQRGQRHFNRVTVEDNAKAQTFYQAAIDLDPYFAGGYVGLARAQIQAATVLRKVTIGEGPRSAEILARKALELDPNDAEAWACLGLAYWARGDLNDALTEIEKALLMSPNLAAAHFFRAITLIDVGRIEEGLRSIETWFRLDPRNPLRRLGEDAILRALYFSRKYEKAVEVAVRILREYPDFTNPYRLLAASLAQLGRLEEAKEALQKAMDAAPETFDLYFRDRAPYRRPEDQELLVEGLRKAGWRG